jgi:hypothetical protein
MPKIWSTVLTNRSDRTRRPLSNTGHVGPKDPPKLRRRCDLHSSRGFIDVILMGQQTSEPHWFASLICSIELKGSHRTTTSSSFGHLEKASSPICDQLEKRIVSPRFHSEISRRRYTSGSIALWRVQNIVGVQTELSAPVTIMRSPCCTRREWNVLIPSWSAPIYHII